MFDSTWSSQLEAAFLRARQLENITSGHRSGEKGRLAEQRCVNIVAKLSVQFPSIISVRLATDKEDARGIDVVVETDLGKLYLQVKSSHYGAHKYRRKRPNAKTIVIIIPSEMSDDKLQNVVADRLGCLRKQIKRLRRSV